MIEVGAFEAKTHLSALLEKVRLGEEVLITRRGKAVARLVPAEDVMRSEVSNIIGKLISLRKDVTLNGISWKDLRDKALTHAANQAQIATLPNERANKSSR